MARIRRAAELKNILVYADEPQVVHLWSKTVPVVAVAIPSGDPAKAMFAATTATKSDWERYLDGVSDLRYLFTFPSFRSLYTFDLHELKNGKVTMEPWEGDFPEDYLPEPKFFARFHTEPLDNILQPVQTETLLVDGEWELQEFGAFYQRYSEIYAFIVSVMNWCDASVSQHIKALIKEAYITKPFQGGGSYLYFFSDLFRTLRREERLGLDKVQYASPGFVDINGRDEAFDWVQSSLLNFLENHKELHKAYTEVRKQLSSGGYLRMPGEQFLPNDPMRKIIEKSGRELAELLDFKDYDQVLALSNGNALVAIKVLMSFYRRLEDAGRYFAQGRVAFS